MTDRLVLVTGAGSGIGRSTALRFAADGDRVLATDIDETAAQRTADLITEAGQSAQAFRLDVRDPVEWQQLAETTLRLHGVVDVLVNNAGFGMAGAFVEHSATDWEDLLAVNLLGVVHGCRVFGGHMIDRGQGGHIVNVASGAAYFPIAVASAYCTSKAGVRMLSECLRVEFAPHRIGVSAICPSYVHTGLVANAKQLGLADDEAEVRRRLATRAAPLAATGPDRVAAAIFRAVRRNTALVPVKFESRLAYWVSRLSPGMLRGVSRIATNDRLITRLTRITGRKARREVHSGGTK